MLAGLASGPRRIPLSEFDLREPLLRPLCVPGSSGPEAAGIPHAAFFHQLPKTAALDVQWTPGEPVLLAKYLSGQDTLWCWTGKAIESPGCPPTGGCATRLLMEIDRLDDVCKAYHGAHPVFFYGDRGDARRLKAFARMYRLKLDGNLV